MDMEDLILIGYTNGDQIEYCKEDSGVFYPDSEQGCIIPVYILKSHEHRIETTKFKHQIKNKE